MIKILLIEDNAEDIEAIKATLNSSGGAYLDPFVFTVAQSFGQGLKILKEEKIDVVILDLGLPDANNFDGIDYLKCIAPIVPIVVLTKQMDETLIAIEAVRRGAQDYFSKCHLGDSDMLERIVRHAIERKKHEQELVVAREDALKGSKAKSEFLANMSHDIRTPLNCIIGVSDLLSRAQLSEENRNYVQMLRRASDNLLSLINNILDLSKIEAGQLHLSRSEFDLLSTVENVLDIISTRAHAKGLEMIFKIAQNVPRKLVGDSGLLNQLLVNFLGNAVKFTKSGEVTLEISVKDFLDDFITLQFCVRDTGVGIPQDKLSVIFESFTQLEQNDSSLKKQGSGLGLSICKRIIELMRGTVQVRSEIDKGSIFEFHLPFLRSEKSCEELIIPNLNLEQKRVLIVDDNRAHSLVLKEILRSWKATVECAANRAEAIRLTSKMRFAGHKFDLALLDLRMPGVESGGLDLSSEIKDDVKAIIMMLPVNHRYGDLDHLKAVGIDKYYFKPTKAAQLAKIISEILEGRSSPAVVSESSAKILTPKRSRQLLIADDSEDNRLLIEAYCKDTEFALEIAEDGSQAVDFFKRKNFDLVLMDIQMPRMNGYEALSAIRDWEVSQRRSQVPVLALTAFALTEEVEKCISAGFKAHVSKPITKNELIDAIRKYAA